MKFKIKNITFYSTVIIFMFLLILLPTIATDSIKKAISLCCAIIFPSLFPFTVCVLMVIRYGININNKNINNFLYKTLGHNFNMFFVFILSLLGGYPIGIKLIDELNSQKIINDKSADIMSMYCVNAGPSFIVSVIGSAIASKKIGIILLISNTLSSVLIAIICSKKLKKQHVNFIENNTSEQSLAKNFVTSVNDAIDSLIKICSFIIIFSVINAYLDYFIIDLPIIKYISLFTEVSTAVNKCKNIYFISLLIGFGGISVWCQIFSLKKGKKCNLLLFVSGRILHSILNAVLTFLIISIFKIEIPTYTNGVNIYKTTFYSNNILAVSISIMLIVLFAFINSKNNSGKIIEDVI